MKGVQQEEDVVDTLKIIKATFKNATRQNICVFIVSLVNNIVNPEKGLLVKDLLNQI